MRVMPETCQDLPRLISKSFWHANVHATRRFSPVHVFWLEPNANTKCINHLRRCQDNTGTLRHADLQGCHGCRMSGQQPAMGLRRGRTGGVLIVIGACKLTLEATASCRAPSKGEKLAPARRANAKRNCLSTAVLHMLLPEALLVSTATVAMTQARIQALCGKVQGKLYLILKILKLGLTSLQN